MDRRQNKTQAQIKAVFVTLLAEMPIEKITVSRIADLANINRGTFYRHYKDVYDLHDQVLSDLMTDMTQIFKATYPSKSTYHDDFKTLSYLLVTYIEQHKSTVAVLLNHPQAGAQAFRQVKRAFIQKVLLLEKDRPNNIPSLVEIDFIVSGIMGLVTDYVSQQLTLTADELYEEIYRLLQKF